MTISLAAGNFPFIRSRVSALLCCLVMAVSWLRRLIARATGFKLQGMRCSPIEPRFVFHSADIQVDRNAFKPEGSV